MSDLFPIGHATPEGTLIRPELAQAMEEYRDAFVQWAVAAYAVELNQSDRDAERRARLLRAQSGAVWGRDDAHIEFVSSMFTWGGDPDSDAYDMIDRQVPDE